MMWNKIKQQTPPTGEIVRIMWSSGVEGFAVYRDGVWYQPTEHARLTTQPTHWKRMGT